MVEKRLNDISSSKEIFQESKKEYEDALKMSGYKTNLEYRTDRNKRNDADSTEKKKKKKNRKRKVHWFNPPYNLEVETNVGQRFLKLVDKHFGNERKDKLHKVLNRKTLKLSYSCTQNFANIIKSHYKSIQCIYEREREKEGEHTGKRA